MVTSSPPGQRSTREAPAAADIAAYFPQLEIIERIGAGGMGVVYRARQPKLDRLVALKILPAETGQEPAFAERFLREARVLARLSHPGIVTIHDFGQAGPFYYLLMEYVDGADLRRLMKQGRIATADVLSLVTQICDALAFAHSRGVVHRDIKPGNILVGSDGRVRIADFGLAKMLESSPDSSDLTSTHHVMGTPDYMAPEQREQPKAVDHRADIYSLGVVFYELLTGELPMRPLAPPSRKVRVDVRVDEVVLRSLEREPEQRYQRVTEVKTRLESITAEAAAKTQVNQPAPPKPRRARSARMAVVVTGALLLALTAGLAMPWLRPERRAVLRENPPSFGHATTDSRWFVYQAELPASHRLELWVEWWEHGRQIPLADLSFEDSLATARGRPLKAELALTIWDNPLLPGKPTNMVRWQWGIRGDGVLSGTANYAVDPFAGLPLRDSSYGHSPVQTLKVGETRTLAVLRGDRDRLEGKPWDPMALGRAQLELHFKARLRSVPPAELGDLPTTSLGGKGAKPAPRSFKTGS